MTLDEYFGTEGALKQTALAALIGKSDAFVSLLRAGTRRPSMDTVDAINVATGGLVTGNDWMASADEAAA